MARFAKMAIDAGVADRQIANAERLGEAVGSLLRGVLDDLNLTPEQQDSAPEVAHRHLTRLAGTIIEIPRELR
jgi:hypothetical protein